MENSFQIAPSMMSLYGNQSVDQGLRLTTFGMFGATPSFVPHDFIWNPPKDGRRQDLRQVCAATGYSGPASEFVFIDGVPFLRAFAPDRVAK